MVPVRSVLAGSSDEHHKEIRENLEIPLARPMISVYIKRTVLALRIEIDRPI